MYSGLVAGLSKFKMTYQLDSRLGGLGWSETGTFLRYLVNVLSFFPRSSPETSALRIIREVHSRANLLLKVAACLGCRRSGKESSKGASITPLR
jgi:hypothetical protein